MQAGKLSAVGLIDNLGWQIPKQPVRDAMRQTEEEHYAGHIFPPIGDTLIKMQENFNSVEQTKKQEPYKDISASFKIPGMTWDIKQWIVDLAHEIGNLIKNMLQLTTNKKKHFPSLEKSPPRF